MGHAPTTSSSFAAALAETFKVEDMRAAFEEKRGFRMLPLTGRFIYRVSTDEVIGKIKSILPEDVRLVTRDGQCGNLFASIPGYGADVVEFLFSSNTWPELEEGSLFPRLEPLFLVKPPSEDATLMRIHVPFLQPGDSYELVIDKKNVVFEIPRDRETGDQCVIVVRPK